MEKYKEILDALKMDFPEESIKFREGPKKNGKIQWFKYIPTDLLHERLDEVLGLNWTWSVLDNNTITVKKMKKEYPGGYNPGQKNNYTMVEYSVEQVAVLGRLTITLPDGTSVWRDGFGGCDMNYGTQAGDPFKIADSNAFKKACYKFGIGRYLGLEALDDDPAASAHQEQGNNPFENQQPQQRQNQFNNKQHNAQTTSNNSVVNPFA